MPFFFKFWNEHPALLYGLAFAGGITLAFDQLWCLAPLGMIVFSILEHKHRLLLFSLVVAAAFCYVHLTILMPPDEPIQGKAHIHISSVRPYHSTFREGFIVRGTLVSFVPDGASVSVARNVPFSLKAGKNREAVNQDYVIQATLRHQKHLFVKKGTHWQPVPWTFSLAEWRFQNKESARAYITGKISHSKAASFLSGMATGLFDDNTLHNELSRFGLQHIMAISGFHFALVALLLNLCLRLFLSDKTSSITLVILLTIYFLFLGSSPSILRAFVMATIYFSGKIVERQSRALNSLGAALIAVLILDPVSLMTIGFQFSFLVTAAILIFTSPIEAALQIIFKKRSLSELIDMSPLDQHGYILSNALRKLLALTISVQVVVIPLSLFWFQKFPVLSLLYNMFFPFLASLSLFLLILGLAVSWLPPLAGVIHAINSAYTNWALNLAYQLPMSLDLWIRIQQIPMLLAAGYLCLLFASGIFIKIIYTEKHREQRELAYL